MTQKLPSIIKKTLHKSQLNHLRTSRTLRNLSDWSANLLTLMDSPLKCLARFIEANNIHQVIDVGANIGQFGVDLRRVGFEGEIISFEPDPENFVFLDRLANNDGRWSVFNFALGSKEGSAILKVSGNGGLSSSLLAMEQSHLDYFPESKIVAEKVVKITTLDKFLSDFGKKIENSLVKMDVQGYESEVIKGGKKAFKSVTAAYFEASLTSLYEGELLFSDLLLEFRKFGLLPIQIFPGVTDHDGRMLQVDTLVARK